MAKHILNYNENPIQIIHEKNFLSFCVIFFFTNLLFLQVQLLFLCENITIYIQTNWYCCGRNCCWCFCKCIQPISIAILAKNVFGGTTWFRLKDRLNNAHKKNVVLNYIMILSLSILMNHYERKSRHEEFHFFFFSSTVQPNWWLTLTLTVSICMHAACYNENSYAFYC